MLEDVIEDYLRMRVESYGGRCEKVIDKSRRGCPDREVQWPTNHSDKHGGIDKVELKKPNGKPESHQTRYHVFLADCRVPVYVLDTKDKVDFYINCRIAAVHAPMLFSIPVPYPR